MTTQDEHATNGVRELVARPAARAGIVLVVLWLGAAVLLRGTSEFGVMVALLTCASVVLWATGSRRRLGRGLKAEELRRVLRRYPGDLAERREK